jgi:hypothetical protein
VKSAVIKLSAATACVLALSGCVGSNAVTGKLMEFNVKAVDNRYARGGLNMLLAPVYGLTVAADYVIFNSLEFWTGENPINGKPHIFDTKMDTYIEINDQLDPSLKDAPVSPLTQNKLIEQGQLKSIDENTIQMDFTYNSGEKATLVGIKSGEEVSYYLDGELISQTSLSELEAYTKANS